MAARKTAQSKEINPQPREEPAQSDTASLGGNLGLGRGLAALLNQVELETQVEQLFETIDSLLDDIYPRLGGDVRLNLEKQVVDRLAVLLGVPVDKRDTFNRGVKEVARLLTARAEPSSPALERSPAVSSEANSARPQYQGVRKSGDPITFLETWWSKDIKAGQVTRQDIRNADARLLMAVYRQCRETPATLDDLLPPATRDREDLSGLSAEERLARIRLQTAARTQRARGRSP